jgi:subtilase family serine protease
VTASTGVLAARLVVDPDQTIAEQDDTNNTLLVETTVMGA